MKGQLHTTLITDQNQMEVSTVFNSTILQILYIVFENNGFEERRNYEIQSRQMTISASLTSEGIPTSSLIVDLYSSGTTAPACMHISTTAGA